MHFIRLARMKSGRKKKWNDLFELTKITYVCDLVRNGGLQLKAGINNNH